MIRTKKSGSRLKIVLKDYFLMIRLTNITKYNTARLPLCYLFRERPFIYYNFLPFEYVSFLF